MEEKTKRLTFSKQVKQVENPSEKSFYFQQASFS